jgi:hypothetical protein
MSLTAPERETVITFSDEGDTATVHTHQRRIITKLQNNPAAELVERIDFDGTAGAVFELPADLITFRSGRRKLPRHSVQRRLPTSTERLPEPDFVGYNRRFRRRSPLVGGCARGMVPGFPSARPVGIRPSRPLLSLSPAP